MNLEKFEKIFERGEKFMRDLAYMEMVDKGVFEIIKNEDSIDSRIAEYISIRNYRSDDKLLIRYNKRDASYNPLLKEEIILVIERLQAHLRKDYDVFANLTQDEDCIFIVAVRIPEAPLEEEK